MNILNENYPANNEMQIKQADKYFDEHILKFDPVDRVKIAKDMHTACTAKKVQMRKNASYNSYLDFYIDNDKLCDVERLRSNLEDRAVLLDGFQPKTASIGSPKETLKEACDKWIDQILSFSDKKPILKVAEALCNFDIENGLEKHWDTDIRDPFLSVSSNNDGENNVFPKVASSALDIIDIHNLSCSPELIKKANQFESEVHDKFINNPYEFISKEASFTVSAYLGALEELV